MSKRRREVLFLISEGFSNREIAERLGISTETVKTHVCHILEALGARNRSQAVAIAYREGEL